MDGLGLNEIAQQLSALEVALFLCLVAHEHCLIETTATCIHDLATELALICSITFDFSCSILDCSSATSLEDIGNDIRIPDARRGHAHPSRPWMNVESSSRDRSKSPVPSTPNDTGNIVNIVIAKNFNVVNENIQAQILQLMRSRTLVTENGSLHAPTDFLFIPLVVRESEYLRPPLKTHLSDNLLISHFHDAEDGYIYLEENDWLADEQLSASSVIRRPEKPLRNKGPKIDRTVMEKLQEASVSVSISAEVVRYIQDIVVFLRLSRAVAGGVSARASIQFSRFAQLLAPLHGIDYLTPSIVALAARKVFRHRLIVADPFDDRSLQYGSDLEAVSQVLDGVTPESILDGVLALEPPI
ncbi:hypothetical protein NUU61_004180 [Penicillium alfredii]|uniref:magnesium chelatase n=1 Tax=Penicillium alfredii TaxID=1506179 RepID=A0A9W9FKS9_9EURO|nr:uncharacterized protein NUU61_004180 [Penicillium alfredii]KAJ5101958.1 hypothetical protein NUU61_004180 [Penicillium alfredii]